MPPLQAQIIGTKAQQALAEADQFMVFGNTSRGLFLDTLTGWIVFLSRESYRGPLTLNLGHEASRLGDLRQSERGQVEGMQLTFPQTGVSVSWESARIWKPTKMSRWGSAAIELDIALSGLGDSLIDAILDPQSEIELSVVEKGALAICRGIRSGDWDAAADAASALLGMGAGLTPEGDDFLIGLSLALTRSGSSQAGRSITSRISQSAGSRTTRLSANLLACAAGGLADERLIAAHDALLTNAPDAGKAISTLLGWGSTSGRMALAGIAAGLLTR